MTTDNRTNEPTDEQVEAAAIAALQVLKDQWPEDTQERWSEEDMAEALELQRKAQRAALVAAQGAAPRLIGRLDLARHYWRSQGYDYDLHGLDGNSDYEMGLAVADAALAALADAQGAAPQAEIEYIYCPIHGDLLDARRSFVCEHDKKGHEYAAPVLPSSTVDEIDRAIGSVLFNVTNFPARVQALLLGQDMAPLREKLTRAVVEAIGGEGA